MVKRIIAVLVCLATLCCTFASCSSGGKQQQGNSSAVTTNSDSSDGAEVTTGKYDPGVPVISGEGMEFVVLNSLYQEISGLNEIIIAEYSDELDSVDAAIYNRNAYIEDLYDINFAEIEASSPEIKTRVNESYLSGADDYSLVNVVGNIVYSMGAEGLLYNLNNLEYIDLSREWWTQGAVEDFSLGGQLYYVSSDLTLCDDEFTAMIMYNKVVADNYNLESAEEMYKIVLDGNWTWNKMMELCRAVSTENNGNSEIDEGDIFGITVCDWAYVGFMIGAGERFSEKDEDDYLHLTMEDESFVNKLDEIIALSTDRRAISLPGAGFDFVTTHDIFAANEALMIYQVVAHIRYSRAMETDFAVLPSPKYNEEQSDYYSYTSRAAYIGIPSTITNPDLIGCIVEAWTAKSAEMVIPEYYDIALDNRYMRDDGSKEMIDIIFDSSVYDQAVTTICWGTTYEIFKSFVISRSGNIASTMKRFGSNLNSSIDKVTQAYIDIADRTA